jgi:hypothetical protein
MFVPKHILFQISETKKKEGFYCCAYGCKNKPNPKKRGLCHKHYSRYRRICDPVYDRFVNFKNNALRRSKSFTITLEQFRNFCQETGYIITKGMRGRKCTIDRIRNYEGYHIDNIQILTMNKNIEKYHGVDKHYTELPDNHENFLPF